MTTETTTAAAKPAARKSRKVGTVVSNKMEKTFQRGVGHGGGDKRVQGGGAGSGIGRLPDVQAIPTQPPRIGIGAHRMNERIHEDRARGRGIFVLCHDRFMIEKIVPIGRIMRVGDPSVDGLLAQRPG